MTRRRFDYAAFVAGWRAIAAEHDLNAKTGKPIEREYVYRLDAAGRRRMDYVPVQPDREPLRLCDPSNPRWWTLPELWSDAGSAHSIVEREAIASIAQQARAAHGLGEPRTLADAMTTEFRAIVKEALADDLRAKRRNLPLSELHRLRGVTVEEVAGQRMEVLIKQMA